MMARGSWKVRLSRAHGPLPTRSGLSARVGAASLFAGVALLVLAGCGGSGPAAGSPAGRDRVVGSRDSRYGDTLGD